MIKGPSSRPASQKSVTDLWLRENIRAVRITRQPKLHFVVLEDSHEADRLFQLWAQMKYRKGIATGGGIQMRYHGPQTIAQQRALYGD